VYASLIPERLDGVYSYSAFKSFFVIACYPVNLNIPSQKLWDLQMGSNTQNGIFLEKGFSNFDLISEIYGG
jgi:hypothetical protein